MNRPLRRSIVWERDVRPVRRVERGGVRSLPPRAVRVRAPLAGRTAGLAGGQEMSRWSRGVVFTDPAGDTVASRHVSVDAPQIVQRLGDARHLSSHQVDGCIDDVQQVWFTPDIVLAQQDLRILESAHRLLKGSLHRVVHGLRHQTVSQGQEGFDLRKPFRRRTGHRTNFNPFAAPRNEEIVSRTTATISEKAKENADRPPLENESA